MFSLDLIKNNRNGLIFNNNDIDDLAKKISCYKNESIKIMSKLGYRKCHKGLLLKIIKTVSKKNFI